MAVEGRFSINFSGIHEQEGFDAGVVVDLSGLEGTNCYCDSDARDAIRDSLASVPYDAIHWIDTGDYHYVSLFFLEKIRKPFYLILFDNHPDNQQTAFGDILSCGSWRAVAHDELSNLKESIWIQKYSDVSSLTTIPDGGNVYVSIDIDVLNRDEARTDWDQGLMTLVQIADILKDIFSRFHVEGVDICGGLSEAKGAHSEDLRINAETNSFFNDLLLNLKNQITTLH